VQARPPGARHRAPPPGLAPEGDPGDPHKKQRKQKKSPNKLRTPTPSKNVKLFFFPDGTEMNNTRSTFSTFGGAAPREPAGNQVSSELTVCEARELLYNAALLLSELNQICLILKQDVESEKGWPELFARAMTVKKQLQEKLHRLEDPHILEKVKKKLTSVRKKRERVRRKKTTRLLEKEDQEFRMAEIDERINKWRNQRVQIVEEKKREQELKVAADSVLSEVRKKQVDIKRMVDILKSLEKLRRLRKEAASRKGRAQGYKPFLVLHRYQSECSKQNNPWMTFFVLLLN
uniref:Programmed cell death 7 n=1 Tax=Erpetoichthys calabaricus TaxID=27687 RepID=A0A8C4XHZ0_ERPCA